jgi:hypothetical protein
MKVQLSLRGVLAGVAWSWVIVPVAGAQAIGPEFRANSYIHPLCRGRSCFQAGAARPPLLYSAPAFAFEQWRGSP